MPASITVPRLGWSMEEGTFVEWLKLDGERVQPGDALFVLESDKSAENIEALDAGILCLGPDSPRPGDKVKVGQVIASLVVEGETVPPIPGAPAVSAVRDGDQPEASRNTADTAVAQREHNTADTAGAPSQAISPRARRLAREQGINTSRLQGSGRNGRIRACDVLAAAATPPAGRLIPHTTVRRTIAARMLAGVTQPAPVTLTTTIDATNLVSVRQQFLGIAPDEAPGYTDLIIKLTAAALQQHPMLQAQWRDDGLFVPERIDIALGVDSEAGLFAPVVRDAGTLTLRQVAARTRELIQLARAGQLTAEHMRDATFTLSNLGMFGVDVFTPIINLPQCAVLGIGRIVREPAVHEGAIVPRDRITLSLTFDHRIVDGTPAARFLHTLARCIAQPVPWLLP